jgi:hypothetical protein
VADDEGITFTLTEALAGQLNTYYCTAHPAPLMEGPLEVVSPKAPLEQSKLQNARLYISVEPWPGSFEAGRSAERLKAA